MSHFDELFHIEIDLPELGDRPAPTPHYGPADRNELAFALALATGDIPANSPTIDQDQAA
ncbi:MAG: hypothetical protein ACT4PK_07350 [Gammaproteobacteria bacterium]